MTSQGRPMDMVVNDGGIPAQNEKGEHIYLNWGMLDLLQEYDIPHKIQYLWKAVRHGCDRLPDVSVNPPDKYRGFKNIRVCGNSPVEFQPGAYHAPIYT